MKLVKRKTVDGQEIIFRSPETPEEMAQLDAEAKARFKEVSEKTATAADWGHLPMPSEREEIDFEQSYDDDSFAKIQKGYAPYEMEDRIFMYMEDNILYIHLTFTCVCIFEIHFAKVGHLYKVVRAYANANPKQYIDGAKLDANRARQLIGEYLLDRA